MPTDAQDATLPLPAFLQPGGAPLDAVPTGDVEPVALLVPSRPLHVRRSDLIIKRSIDIVGAALLLLLVLPLFIACAIGVKLSSPGPIFFRQLRVGRGGKRFTIFKFRTFPVEHEPPAAEHVDDAVVPTAASDIPWGRLLRRTSVDELPQLLNVLRGDMSLVGPRPERPELALTLNHQVPDYAERHRMAAGITGLAQISGLVGNTSIAERVAADNRYIDGWHIGRDLKILVKTIPAVIKKLHW